MLRVGISGTVAGERGPVTLGATEGVGTLLLHLVPALAAREDVTVVLTTTAADRPTAGTFDSDATLATVTTDGEHFVPGPDAQVDVWLLPSMHSHAPRDGTPHVVLIHDLVTEHLPELFAPAFVEAVRRKAREHARAARLVGCMSAYTRDGDLLGVLGLDPARVRLVRTAWPVDLVPRPGITATDVVPASEGRPYLLYPAVGRPSKNHEGLIEAFALLRHQHGVDLDLVFTAHALLARPELARLAETRGVRDRLHDAGQVPRPVLAALYWDAFATVVPTLHEQGSYPAAEALAARIPLACSDIPPLREQLAALGGTVRWFDPRDPASIAGAILEIVADRDGVLAEQQAVTGPLWDRTWDQVASEWLAVLREATTSANTST